MPKLDNLLIVIEAVWLYTFGWHLYAIILSMAEIRRCVTYQGSSVSKKNAKLNISHFHTAVSHDTDSVLQEDIHTSDVDSPLKRISRNVERKKDKEVS